MYRFAQVFCSLCLGRRTRQVEKVKEASGEQKVVVSRNQDHYTTALTDRRTTTRAHSSARGDVPTVPWFDTVGAANGVENGVEDVRTRQPRRPRLTRKRAVPGVVTILLLGLATILAIGPVHLFVHAAPPFSIYDDSLASGWHNWSYESTTNLANTAPVYAGSRAIAWKPNAGWATLYLRSGSPISLGGYSALRFAMRASHANTPVGIALTNASNRVIARLAPLNNYGGAPPVGSWRVYTIPLSALGPTTAQAYGVMWQNWSNYPASTMYVDSVELLPKDTATPTPAATATVNLTPAATATATANPMGTATSTPSPTPPGPVLPGAPDTTANIHVGLPAMTDISSGQSLLNTTPTVQEVWDWNGGGSVTTYPNIYAGKYFPVDRQPDSRYYSGAEPLSWFQTNHPDWLEYKCDRSTIAYEFGQTTDIPLDTSNPAVLSWLESTFYAPAAKSGFGHLDFDNFQMSNAGSWSGQRCGHWTGAPGSSTWVAQYNGTSNDANYRANEVAMARNLQSWLHANFPHVAFAANFSYDNQYPTDSDSLMSHVDLLFDEQGFSNGNNGPPYNYTGAAWVAKAQHTWSFISAGHGWQDMNQFGNSFGSLTTAQKQWAIANYLLLKNSASWIYICGPQEYGTLLMTPEYNAPVGSPTDTYYQSQSVYMRDFTNGLALVNPSASSSYTVTLSGTHHDLYGNAVGTQVTLPPASGLVLLNG